MILPTETTFFSIHRLLQHRPKIQTCQESPMLALHSHRWYLCKYESYYAHTQVSYQINRPTPRKCFVPIIFNVKTARKESSRSFTKQYECTSTWWNLHFFHDLGTDWIQTNERGFLPPQKFLLHYCRGAHRAKRGQSTVEKHEEESSWKHLINPSSPWFCSNTATSRERAKLLVVQECVPRVSATSIHAQNPQNMQDHTDSEDWTERQAERK